MRNDDDGVCFMLLVEGTNDLWVGHVLSHVSCHLMLQITDSSSFHISQFKPSHVLCSSISWMTPPFDWRARRHLSALELSTAIVLLWHGLLFSFLRRPLIVHPNERTDTTAECTLLSLSQMSVSVINNHFDSYYIKSIQLNSLENTFLQNKWWNNR